MEQETQEQTNKFNNKIYYILPEFSGKNVPIIEVAKLMGKDQQFIRQGIIRGIFRLELHLRKQSQMVVMKGKNHLNTIFRLAQNYYGNILE